ncbi:MAG: hypothetical protein ACRDNM_00100 [Gaiellaceae bacterium]
MIEIVARCEVHTCNAAQAFAFEFSIETFAHLVEALVDAGWHVAVADQIVGEGGRPVSLGMQRRTHTYCPAHAVALDLKRADDEPGGDVVAQTVVDERPLERVSLRVRGFELEDGTIVEVDEKTREA